MKKSNFISKKVIILRVLKKEANKILSNLLPLTTGWFLTQHVVSKFILQSDLEKLSVISPILISITIFIIWNNI